MVSLSEMDKENPIYLDSLHENAKTTLSNIPLSVYPVKHERRLSLYRFGTRDRRLSNSCGAQLTAIGGKEYWSLSDMIKKGRIK